jgi:hypothetical protein
MADSSHNATRTEVGSSGSAARSYVRVEGLLLGVSVFLLGGAAGPSALRSRETRTKDGGAHWTVLSSWPLVPERCSPDSRASRSPAIPQPVSETEGVGHDDRELDDRR